MKVTGSQNEALLLNERIVKGITHPLARKEPDNKACCNKACRRAEMGKVFEINHLACQFLQ